MIKPICEKMSSVEHKDKTFKLLWVMDMHARAPENYYRVLFRAVKTREYLLENIYPEYLWFYTMGSYYKSGERDPSRDPEGEEVKIQVHSGENNRLLSMSEVLSGSGYQLKHSTGSIDFTDEIKRQYCFYYENNKADVIIPCSAIGAVYYFLSTQLRQKIFELSLESLYENINHNPKDNVYGIKVKRHGNEVYAPDMIRYAISEYAAKRWKAIRHSLFKESTALKNVFGNHLHAPVKIDFPVNQKLNLLVRGKQMWVKGKPKILVFSILGEDSKFGFDRCQVTYRKGHEFVNKVVEIPDKRMTKVAKMLNRKRPGITLKRL